MCVGTMISPSHSTELSLGSLPVVCSSYYQEVYTSLFPTLIWRWDYDIHTEGGTTTL